MKLFAMYKLLAILGIILVLSQPILAQDAQTQFEKMPENSPLTKETIWEIYQDRHGFMWFSTKNGLIKYDGYDHTLFAKSLKDSNSLSTNNIHEILEDNKEPILWLGSEMGLDRFDMRTEKFTNYPRLMEGENRSEVAVGSNILQSRDGKIWYGTTQGNGLLLFDPKTEEVLRIFPGKATDSKDPANRINSLLQDKQDYIWFSTQAGVFKLNPQNGQIDLVFRSNNVGSIYLLFEGNHEEIYVLTNGKGLFKYNERTQQFGLLPIDLDEIFRQTKGRDWSYLFKNTLRDKLYLDSKDRLWIKTAASMLIQISLKTLGIQVFHHDPLDPRSLGRSWVESYMEDRDGRMWIGLWQGLNRIDPYLNKFQFIPLALDPQISGLIPPVRSLWPDEQGNLWAVSLGNGINKINLRTGKQEIFNEDVLYNMKNRIKEAIPYNEHIILISKFIHGAFAYNLQEKRYVDFPVIDGFVPDPDFEFCRLNEKTIGLLNEDEGYIFNIETKKLTGIPADVYQASKPYKPIFQDKKGFIWAMFYDKGLRGLIRYHPLNSTSKIFTQGIEHLLDGDLGIIHDFLEDQQGNFWFSSARLGLFRVRIEGDKLVEVRNWTVDNSNIYSNQVFNLEEDDHGKIWLNTEWGLSVFDPQKELFTFFGEEQCGQRFNYGTYPDSYQDEKGVMYFGGREGITYFHPDSLKFNLTPPSVAITDFSINNQEIPIQGTSKDSLGEPSPLTEHINFTKELTLSYDQNDFSFRFSVLDYSNPEKNKYAYILENYHEDWISVDASQRTANFTNIPAGTYIFRIKGANSDGTWNEEGVFIRLTVLSPWWATWWAYMIFAGLIISLLSALWAYEMKRYQVRSEARKYKELNIAKTKLYNNITHEFRTPLSIILGLTEKLQKKSSITEDKKDHGTIYRKGEELLKLINQMLDLSKLEAGHLALDIKQSNIIAFLQYIIESFHSYAESKGIDLHFLNSYEELYMDFDSSQLLHVFSNLISNAIKFSPAGQHVYISTAIKSLDNRQEEVLWIVIKDTGVGIPQEKLPFIFDRFYQVDDSSTRQGEGTGIGLTLTQELVQLMGGTIEVNSQIGKGTEFTLKLPMRQLAKRTENEDFFTSRLITTPVAPIMISHGSEEGETPLMLIVEDNSDLVKFLLDAFNPVYRVEVAYNGQQGIDKASSLIPDIIVTDVMMPEKDGFELCDTLKNQESTSHIPVLMLTAKVDVQSRLTGLRRGADAYLAKPFLQEELFVRVEALLQQKARLQAYFQAKMGANPSSLAELEEVSEEIKIESEFLNKVDLLIGQQLDNHTFGVEALSEAVAMSTSGLFRKLKALTGLSPVQYLRSKRIAKAKEMLQHSDKTISEIAYETGFSDPQYFSRIFKQEEGETPSRFRKKC